MTTLDTRVEAGPRGAMTRWLVPLTAAGLLAALAVMPFVVDNYTLWLLARVLALGLLAVSVALLTGIAGLPTLGQVAPYAVGAYTTVVLARNEILVGPIQLLVSAAAAAVFCAVTGPLVIRARGVVFLMVTLAIGVLTAEVAGQWTTVTGGTDGSGRVPATKAYWGGEPLTDDSHVYWYVLAVAGTVVVATMLVLRSTSGMLLRGCRDNEVRMRASGHRVTGYLLVAYIAAGVIAGIGGSLMVASQRSVAPAEVDFGIAALILLAVVLGGSHSIGGALLGVLLVVAVRDWLSPAGQRDLWLGSLFVICVYLLPHGLAGLGAGVRGRGSAWRRKPTTRNEEKA